MLIGSNAKDLGEIMRNYKLVVIFLLSGPCLSDPINMESINSMHLDAEPTFSVDGKRLYKLSQ